MEIQPVESHYLKLFPLHPCPECQAEHTNLPLLWWRGEVPLLPFELVGVTEATLRLGEGTEWEASVPLLSLLWSLPTDEPRLQEFLHLN